MEVTGNADWNKTYKAKVKLSTGTVGDNVYVFGNSVTVTVDGETLTNAVTPNTDGTLTVTREFTTAKRKIVSIAPAVPTDNTFTTYYGFEGYDASPISGSNTELGTQATVIFEGTMAPTTADMDVTWTIANDGEAAYDRTPGAENIFRWTIPASEFQNYDASACQGYDAATGDITGTVTITNKAATPVNITGTDKGMAYTGEAIDVSKYFAIDTNAGTAAYSLVTGADGGTGEGSLNGTTLTVTKTGNFKIKVTTLANGIYAAGEKNITLTVSKKDTNAPYIKGDNGKEGWDVILGEVNKAQNKDKVIVDMNGASIVPGNVLDEIKGKDITIVFDMGNGITWSINGQSITTGNVGNIDFTVKTGTKSIPVDIINNVTGERNNIQISLNHSGDFGFTAILSVNVDKKNAGLYANLFYYNETTGKMEFICADKIADDGIAELNFTHASDYAIVIDTEPMDGNAPDTGDKTPVAPLLALIIGTGLMAVAFLKKKKFIVKD